MKLSSNILNDKFSKMKIIISHDVDHITVSEHLNDLQVPKFIVRSVIEVILGKISTNELFLRFKNLFANKWNNINEIMEFNRERKIPATFFVGLNNALGLNYNSQLATKWIQKIVRNGFDCGVHGIAFDNQSAINDEYNRFKQISGLENFGIRMHYLRKDTETLKMLAKAGYSFDSTIYSLHNHYFIDSMVEFPLQIMEVYELENHKKWQTRTTREAVKSTLEKLELAKKQGIEYLSILFHDRHFDDSFKSWKDWYVEIIEYCISNNYQFIDYQNAVAEIKNKHSIQKNENN